jgi:predicted nucleotidyltransferase
LIFVHVNGWIELRTDGERFWVEVERGPLKEAFIFGSYTSGDADMRSDLDIII